MKGKHIMLAKQFITDQQGMPMGVFIPMQAWQTLTQQYPDIEKTNSEISEIIRCSDEQRQAIALAQQAVARGEKVYHKDVQKAVELCLSEN